MIIVLAGVLIWQWDKILPLVRNPRHLQALLVILPMIPSIILFIGFIMGWRYNNAGLMLASLVMLLSYLAITMLSSNNPSEENMNLSVIRGIAFLLPLNLASFTMMTIAGSYFRSKCYGPVILLSSGSRVISIFFQNHILLSSACRKPIRFVCVGKLCAFLRCLVWI
jgi:hypothetical protein